MKYICLMHMWVMYCVWSSDLQRILSLNVECRLFTFILVNSDTEFEYQDGDVPNVSFDDVPGYFMQSESFCSSFQRLMFISQSLRWYWVGFNVEFVAPHIPNLNASWMGEVIPFPLHNFTDHKDFCSVITCTILLNVMCAPDLSGNQIK